ncbi:dihydroorotate dehydrogenase [Agromyces flavus]|uniref:Dihydroorotate dehydrogenase (quinone) n=1 Tax=Agromyces flavus TaxID=589382 RepID=A0A1H1S7H6_9MICO|nr:quinone-dependent dihydroorotate dehydrogenase [Agromyces flavus]MCP2368966.1 dihydroorotate dehydrogenase [Agromyces flavus]GGI48422.1 dihydroorotate dehydrogenase (quinone) [Agromyces flavus]SDS43944.1 dihydroorotate oxidase A [Agromyces flavus]
MYRLLFSLVFARMDPERAHHLAFRVIRTLPVLGVGRLVQRWAGPGPELAVEALGLRFPSPFGLAAGFDKDAVGVVGLGDLGFGHVEVGTITAQAQPGNDRPRLFRLVADRALVNRMGFNNGGADAAAGRLSRLARRTRRPVLGVNIGKSRVTPVEQATDDYVRSAKVLAPHADYLVVNVSSPNTPGLRGLQELDALAPLLEAVQRAAGRTPLLVKIAPDLADDEVVRICELVVRLGLDGIIATNTTISRDGLVTPAVGVEAIGAGGLSGAPLATRSLAVLRLIRDHVPASLCVISVGGVETAEHVQERLDAGATLVQGYTAFVYRGPLWARQVNRGLERIRRERRVASSVA